MASKKPNPATAMTDRQKIAARKISSTKPKPTVKTKVENKIKEVKGAYDKVSKTGIPVKGGPRPKMERMVQPMKPKRMAKKGR